MDRALRACIPLLLAIAPASVAAGDLADRSFEVRGPATEQVWVVASPVVNGDQYAITGSVAYENVEGDAFLEMWSEFPDGSRYFSRTLDEHGPMAKLGGSSPARRFVLPFFLTPSPGILGNLRLGEKRRRNAGIPFRAWQESQARACQESHA